MAVFLNDTFTDTDGTLLQNHTGETGATWTYHPTAPASSNIEIRANRARLTTAYDEKLYYASGIPADADYDVEAIAVLVGATTDNYYIAVAGRLSTSAYTCYRFGWSTFSSSWELTSMVAGSESALDSHASNVPSATPQTVKLEMRGTTIKGYLDGVEVCAVTGNSDVSAVGRAGIAAYGYVTDGDPYGTQFNSITGTDLSASSQILRPSADSVDGTWTDQAGGTSLYAAIDETSASDSDYIRSPLTPSNSGTRIKVGTGSSPQAGTRTFRWRIGKDVTGGGTINMTMKVYQGGGDSLGAGTLVQEFTRNNVDAATTYAETVTGTITNYADLYVEFYANQV